MKKHLAWVLLGGVVIAAALVWVGLSIGVRGDYTQIQPDKCAVWADVGKDDIVLKIGDESFTKNDIDQYVDMQRRLVELHHEIRPGKREEMVGEFLKRSALTFPVFKFVSEQFPKGVELTSDMMAKQRRGYLLQFGSKKQKWADFEKDLDKAGLLSDVNRILVMEAKFEYVLSHAYSNELTVTDADLAAMNAKIDAYLAMVSATNALNYAAASNAWRRLERGEDFAKVADECSQDSEKEPGGDWGEKTKDDFIGESAHYQDVVAHLKEGDHTEVLESETGLDIIKLVKIVPAVMSNSGENSWHLARIFFRRAYVPDRESNEVLRNEMGQDKRVEFLAKVTDNAVREGKIVYPFSRRVFRLKVPKGDASPMGEVATDISRKAAATNGVDKTR